MAVDNSVDLEAGWPSRSGRASPMCCGRWSSWRSRSCEAGPIFPSGCWSGGWTSWWSRWVSRASPKSQVSEMSKVLGAQVQAFRNRPLEGGPYAFVWVDALTQKVREGGRIVNVLVATGVNADGHREILGVEVTSAEDGAGWLAFLRGLVACGDVVRRPHDDAVVEPDMSCARLGNLAVGGGVETDVVERTGGQGNSDRGDSGAAAVKLGVVVALSRSERSYDQPGDEHPPSGPHRYLQ